MSLVDHLAMYFICGAPFGVALAGVCLYRLLSWSAFFGH